MIERARKDTLLGNSGLIDVIDSGAGLSSDARGRIFNPFFTTKENSTGLGLSNVKKIVELHGGDIMAANATEGGAVFSIRLRLAQGIAA